jgi:hypothetical protein
MKEIKKIFSFEDSLANVAAYEALGFDVTVDDAANGIFYVEVDLTDYDWLNALALLEDCQREGLQPILQHNGNFIDWEDAHKYADLKAFEELSNIEEEI